MKIKRKTKVLRRFEDIADGHLVKQIGNKVKLHRSAGHMFLECPICGIQFSRKASEVKRHETSYCGRGCSAFAQRRQLERKCRVCGKSYTVKQSLVNVITCCGHECRSKAISQSTSARDKIFWKTGVFRRGHEHPGAKLSEADIAAIISDQRKHRIIANDYGVTRANISRIKRLINK